MKKHIVVPALILAAIMIFSSITGCSDSKAYLTVDGEDADDTIYIYYLKSYMYKVMSSYGATQSAEAFWTASLDDGVTAFDMAVKLADEKVASELIINRKFDEYGLTWGDEEQKSFDSMYGSISENGDTYQNFLSSQGLTDESVKTILTNTVKQSSLHTFLISEGQELYITEERLREYYDKTYFGAKHILFKTIDGNGNELSEEEQQNALSEANRTIAELNAGADFNTLMQERSDDVASKDKTDGVLYKRSDVVEEFAAGADLLEPGEFSETPVKSFYGYYVIMKLDLFEQNRDDIYNELASNQFNDLVSQWISEAKINVNESRISKINPTELIA